MCSTKAVYSWDVQIKKFQNMLFIDKRDEEGSQNMLDCQTVSETALPDYTPIDDDTINGTRQLMKETAVVHTNLLQFAQDSKKFTKLERDDPHEEAEDQKMLRIGYRYKIYKLGEGLTVCIRCQNHFHNESRTEGFSNLFVLLEWNHKRQGWTKELDQMTMVMLNKEVTDNASKFNRWTMQSILDGVDKMRFAFVQRTNFTSNKAHNVVGFVHVKPDAFASQINLNVQNCWAVLKDVVQTVLQQEHSSAEYLYMKDPVQPNYKLIHMVKSENEDDEGSDEDDGF